MHRRWAAAWGVTRPPLLIALTAAWTVVWWALATAVGGLGDMAWWHAPLDDLYVGQHGQAGFYAYSPAFAQLLLPLRMVPLGVMIWLLGAANLVALALCARRLTPLLIVFPPVLGEIMGGNIHLLYAAAIVAGFRWPGLWAFMLLTKVTPGVGLLWFAVRREWRSLGIALGVTAGIAGVSFVAAPGAWLEWLAMIWRTAGGSVDYSLAVPTAVIAVPLLLRLPLAAALVAWGALTDRRWTVPVGAMLALPILWTTALAMLVAIIPLWRRTAEAASARASAQVSPRSAGRRLPRLRRTARGAAQPS